MDDSSRKITFSGVNPPSTTVKVVRRQIEKWIERERRFFLFSRPVVYHAHIDREEYRYYACLIEMTSGFLDLSGFGEGRSIHESVINALKDIHPKRSLERRKEEAYANAVSVSWV